MRRDGLETRELKRKLRKEQSFNKGAARLFSSALQHEQRCRARNSPVLLGNFEELELVGDHVGN